MCAQMHKLTFEQRKSDEKGMKVSVRRAEGEREQIEGVLKYKRKALEGGNGGLS